MKKRLAALAASAALVAAFASVGQAGVTCGPACKPKPTPPPPCHGVCTP